MFNGAPADGIGVGVGLADDITKAEVEIDCVAEEIGGDSNKDDGGFG